VVSIVAFHIGESSGEDNDDPNVATFDGRAPPQGSTAPRWWGASAGRGGARGDQACGCMAVGRAAGLQGYMVVYVLLSPYFVIF
jgi:hypothetical protein